MAGLKCYGEKCSKDNVKHDKESLQKIGQYNYCSSCYDIEMKNRQEQRFMVDKISKKICDMYQIPKITKQMNEQLIKFRTKEKFSYEGIFLSLNYIEEFCSWVDLTTVKYGVGAIANVYEEALEYYRNKKSKVNNTVFDDSYIEPEKIVLSKKDFMVEPVKFEKFNFED